VLLMTSLQSEHAGGVTRERAKVERDRAADPYRSPISKSTMSISEEELRPFRERGRVLR
jgi:hypothetical protein